MLLKALTSFVSFVLRGDTHPEACPNIFGVSLIALNKKDGRVHPITVGCTLRWLVAKSASMSVISRMGAILSPTQLGFGTPLGLEAAIHSARLYLKYLPTDNVVAQLNFKLLLAQRRGKILDVARHFVLELLPFIFSCYSAPSNLYFGESIQFTTHGLSCHKSLGCHPCHSVLSVS